MVAGYHLIFTPYGWWLPNDPRGSSSHEIRVETIAELGDLHHGRKRVQPPGSVLRQFYGEAREVLTHELLPFDRPSRDLLGDAFAEVIRVKKYTCYACAIMPDHIHVLIRRHRDYAEEMMSALRGAGATALKAAGKRPANHPVWGGPGWKVFLNTQQDMERIVAYINNNPIKAGLLSQQWRFVTPYDGWLPLPNYRR